MEAFLKDNSLDRLCDALSDKLTLDESLTLLDEGRPALLARLKELGVRKPPDLSAFAKAVANGRREMVGTGVPIIVCLYSAGMTPEGGRSLMKKSLEALAANGFKDSIIYDHHNEKPYDEIPTFDQYVKAVHAQLMEDPLVKGTNRPFIFLAHSHGSNGAYGLAKAVGPKARLLCVLGRRSPTIELIGDVFGEPTCAGIGRMTLQALAVQLGKVYSNDVLQAAAEKDPDETKWIPGFRDAAIAAKAQYSSPVCLCDIDDIVKVFGEGVRGSPTAVEPSCVLKCPIFCATAQETPKGETAEKMDHWRCLTSGAFTHKTFDSTLHMELPTAEEVIKAVVEAAAPFKS
jgi:hypothetical protein